MCLNLLSARYVEFEVQLFSYKEHLQALNESVVSRQSMIRYLTIDDDITVAREYRSLEAITDNYSKIIVSMDDIAKKNTMELKMSMLGNWRITSE